MIIKTATFTASYPDIKDCPKETVPEFAFIGRSNVGKSSLINAITNFGNLAKISSTPGKTQCINFFKINKEWNLVDLPGYGYAKVSKSSREKWTKMIFNYLTKRENLLNIFVLIDSRISPQDIDVEFINELGRKGLPFSLIFTKIDKITQSELQHNLAAYKRKLMESWDELPVTFVSSSKTKFGRIKILDYIQQLIDEQNV